MMHDYDRRAIVAGRVTFGRFGRPDGDGGTPSSILLDGVVMGEIVRVVDSRNTGVMQKVYTVQAYVPSFQGPIVDVPRIAALDDKPVTNLPELKRAIVRALGDLPVGVSEAYRQYRDKRITPQEWRERVEALL